MKTSVDLKQLAREKLSPSALFLLILCLTELITLVMIVTCRGNALGDLLFQNRIDSFMDYFHPLMTYQRFSVESMYADAKVFYPPLAMVFYLIMYNIIPHGSMPEDDFVARERQITAFPFLLLTVLIAVATVYLLCSLRKGKDLENKLFAVAALLCAPMLYLLDRGNIILPAFLFTLLFLHWKDSASRTKRELALISLAIAAGLKIYPALFGLVLLLEKRWKAALRCAIYGILAFVLPALVFGGINPLDMIGGLSDTSVSTYAEGFGYKVNFSNTFAYLCSTRRISCPRGLLNALSYLLGALTLGSAFLHKESWKRLCVVAILIAAIPGLSYMYVMIFMLIPAVTFLNESDASKRSPLQYVYAVVLVLCLVPLPFTGVPYGIDFYTNPYPMTVTTLAESIALVLLSLLLIGESCMRLWHILRNRLTDRTPSDSIDSSSEPR